jgi:hypothetical protein
MNNTPKVPTTVDKVREAFDSVGIDVTHLDDDEVMEEAKEMLKLIVDLAEAYNNFMVDLTQVLVEVNSNLTALLTKRHKGE